MNPDDFAELGLPTPEEEQRILEDLFLSGDADAAIAVGGEAALAHLIYLRLYIHTRTHLALIHVLRDSFPGDEEACLIAESGSFSTAEKLEFLLNGGYRNNRAIIRAALLRSQNSLIRIALKKAARILAGFTKPN